MKRIRGAQVRPTLVTLTKSRAAPRRTFRTPTKQFKPVVEVEKWEDEEEEEQENVVESVNERGWFSSVLGKIGF